MHKKILKKDFIGKECAINALKSKLKDKSSRKLIIYGNNNEFYKGLSNAQKYKVPIQA